MFGTITLHIINKRLAALYGMSKSLHRRKSAPGEQTRRLKQVITSTVRLSFSFSPGEKWFYAFLKRLMGSRVKRCRASLDPLLGGLRIMCWYYIYLLWGPNHSSVKSLGSQPLTFSRLSYNSIHSYPGKKQVAERSSIV